MGRRRFSEPEASGPINTLHGATAVAELDLHGETADPGRQKVVWFVDRWRKQHPGAVVRIITGRGNRSTTGTVLLPMVRDHLDGACAHRVQEWRTELSGGSVVVLLKGGG